MSVNPWELFKEKQQARKHAQEVVGDNTGAWRSWFDFIDTFAQDSRERAVLTATFVAELDSLDQDEHDPELADIW